ncbi:MAG TPA: hypothetical protein VL132_22070 [Planctomycetaceae bacterium]|nr:hypothetical protein [Planctomycetaceae bacterium]
MKGLPYESIPPRSSSVLSRYGPCSVDLQALQRDGMGTAVSRTFGLPPRESTTAGSMTPMRCDTMARRGVQRAILCAQQRLVSEVVET